MLKVTALIYWNCPTPRILICLVAAADRVHYIGFDTFKLTVSIDVGTILFFCFIVYFIFPRQRKLMGSSAQISSGVCRCGSQEQVPEEGSRRFRRVPVCAGVGSGGRFWKVPESSGFQVPESSGGFRCVLV